ncbi:MAG TPA: isoprenylcysteine carboxylmethyltransferase family protein [Chlorobaculum sp.]|nr:isoprenylcysteine carboxylmethyltransferase family protein [Chlorobaculum sp.]
MIKPENQRQRFGSRGEYLVAFQVLLMAVFVMTPAWPELQGTELYRSTAILRLGVLAICWTAAAIFGIGGFLALRKFLTPLPYPTENNRLIQTGVYGLVRHPIYTGLLFAALGLTVFDISLSHLLLIVVGSMFFNHKASKEEAWLAQRHPGYAGYARRVGRFLPRFRRSASKGGSET